MSPTITPTPTTNPDAVYQNAPTRFAAPPVGTQTLLVPDRSRGISSHIMSIPVGSLYDPVGKEGLAYLTSQMMMRGAGDYSRAQLQDELDTMGASLGVGTGRQRTTISGDCLTRNLGTWQDIAGAVMGAPHFDTHEFDKLKRQTLSELAQVRDRDAALGRRFFARALYGGHPYGRPVKGTEETIPRITIADVSAFYRRHFTGRDALYGAAGDLDAGRQRTIREATLGRLPDNAYERVTIPAPPKGDGIRVVFVDKPERTQTQVFIGHTTINGQHPDYFPLYVGQTIYGGTFTARLSHEIREKRGWSYGAYSSLSTDQHLGTFSQRFYPSNGDTLDAIKLCDALLCELVATGVTDEEMEATKQYLMRSHPFSIDTPERRLSEELGVRLNGRAADYLTAYADYIGGVQAPMANAAIARNLRPDDVLITVVGTAKDLAADIEAWDRVTSMEVVDYKTVLPTG